MAYAWPAKLQAEGISGSFPARTGSLGYDRRNKVVVLYGGDTKAADSWIWTFEPAASEWRQARPPAQPSPREGPKLVWHEKLGAFVMFGGAPKWGTGGWLEYGLNDLWVYETAADRWTEVKTPVAPPPCCSATTYDESQDLVVLFNDKGQTWVLKIERAGGPVAQP
jgi:hypothetical protein